MLASRHHFGSTLHQRYEFLIFRQVWNSARFLGVPPGENADEDSMNRTQTLIFFIFLFSFPKCCCFVWPQLSACADTLNAPAKTLFTWFFSSVSLPASRQCFHFHSLIVPFPPSYISPPFCFFVFRNLSRLCCFYLHLFFPSTSRFFFTFTSLLNLFTFFLSSISPPFLSLFSNRHQLSALTK